jgi:MFS family permease
MGPLGTHFYNPALLTIAEEFDCSETLVNASVTVYSLVLAIAPLVWGPMSDRMGRRPVYLAAASVFVVGCLGCWFSINIYMLIAFRFLQGAGGSAVMSVGAGTIADIHRKEERGRAMGLYWGSFRARRSFSEI